MEIVRLGQGVDRTGRLAPEALARTFAACDDYAAAVRDAGAERRPVRRHLGLPRRREPRRVRRRGPRASRRRARGRHRRRGGRAVLHRRDARADRVRVWPSPFLVVDIGGGSTELVLGTPGAAPQAARSVDVGCVRMTERHLHDDPPTPAQVAAARADIEAAIRLAARDGAARRGAHPRRPRRLGHHGRGDGPRPADVRPGPHPPRTDRGSRRPPGRRPPARR